MVKNYDIVVPVNKEEAGKRTDTFFKVNGYFKTSGRAGTYYSKSIKSSIALSPKRISSDLLIRFEESAGHTRILIEAELRALTGMPSPTDIKYFDDFFYFMEACMATNVMEVYNIPTLDGVAKNERRVQIWLLALLVLTLFPLLFLTNSVSRVAVLLVIGITLFLVFNQRRKQV